MEQQSDTTTMGSADCVLCKNKAFFPADADLPTKMRHLVEHVRMDIGYCPYYCPYCVGSWPSYRLFEMHYQLKHPTAALCHPFMQDESGLKLQVERITEMVFPTILRPDGDSQQLAEYLESRAATHFINELQRWSRSIHKKFVFLRADTETRPDDDDEAAANSDRDQGSIVPKREPIEDSFMDAEPLAEATKNLTTAGEKTDNANNDLAESSKAIGDDQRMENLQVPEQQPIADNVEPAAPVEKPVIKKHVYARYDLVQRHFGSGDTTGPDTEDGSIVNKKSNEAGPSTMSHRK